MIKRRYAFSLIEILVVISIISLLLAVLLPSLSGARRRSRSVLCLVHLRSLGQGWQMYADDNNDLSLPGRFFKAPGGTGNSDNWYNVGNGLKYRPRWVAAMGKYVGLFAFDRPRTDSDRQDYDSNIYQCPTVPNWIDERNYGYGYNLQFLGNARKTNGQFHHFPVNRSSIFSFASTVMAGDSMGTAAGFSRSDRRPYENGGKDFASWGNHGWALDPPRLTGASDRGTGDAGSPRTAVDPRHDGKANVIYCDGHGETQSSNSLGYLIDSRGKYVDGGPAGPGQPTNHLFSGTARNDDPPELPG